LTDNNFYGFAIFFKHLIQQALARPIRLSGGWSWIGKKCFFTAS